MTSLQRLILSRMIKESLAQPSMPQTGQNPAASTLLRGVSGQSNPWTQMMHWGGQGGLFGQNPGQGGLFGQNINQPTGPAAIGAPKIPPGGLTTSARPGLKV